ncbi:hypothetical protein STEG23_037011, partial [Scotinomys teguina]
HYEVQSCVGLIQLLSHSQLIILSFKTTGIPTSDSGAEATVTLLISDIQQNSHNLDTRDKFPE